MLLPHELSVGNSLIDSEHKKLHDIINNIAGIIKAGEVAALSDAFKLLENSLRDYFVVEENIAQALNFDFTQHRLAHQHLLKEFQRIRDVLMAKNGMWPKSEKKGYIDCLMACLTQHIEEDGRPLKAVLSTQFYDFKPAYAGGNIGLHGCF